MRTDIRGLSNLDGRNLCYQNSVLQCILRIPAIRRYLMGATGPLSQPLRGVWEYLEHQSEDTGTVELFRDVVQVGTRWTRGEQHDAGAFVHWLLAEVASELQPSRPPYEGFLGVNSSGEETMVAMFSTLEIVSSPCAPGVGSSNHGRQGPPRGDFIHVVSGLKELFRSQ